MGGMAFELTERIEQHLRILVRTNLVAELVQVILDRERILAGLLRGA